MNDSFCCFPDLPTGSLSTRRREEYILPPKVEYSLTDLGKAIDPALQALGNWGNKAYALNKFMAQENPFCE
ncbi:MAG TPA: winged helix-turn-helix transcriptional regulator [Candidatus Eisenbergiella merdigallinarum]|uniref:Winged helix-turn-helix transcriptional regulator n=1 Tax=Candidatus Eisenbergiella merdigallinarum TaxID=2838552 RepID=A0A9D2MSX4_9FIRM|nr:winged helix-turn-helix transcriptional regulator [Candidatus Eisenbergiella merdigallinarum]